MNLSKTTLIDCTLRDGGYYTNWDFDPELVKKYINALYAAGINHIELGYRSKKQSGYFGALAYSKEEFISEININHPINFGVMINASEIVTTKNVNKYMKELFPNPKKKSAISFVRIATKFNELKTALEAVLWLKEKGFKVCINLMYISSLTDEELQEFAKKSNFYKPDILYIGDSTGTLLPDDIKKIIRKLRINWDGEIGIHAHDNMHRALLNTLEAINNGVTWIDSTVQGMGRGPGNTKTEDLVFEIKDINDKNIDFLPLIDLVQNEFFSLKQKYKWGSNPFYYLSGKNQIHPTYIQNMLDDKSYRNEDIYASIKELKKTKSISYKKNQLKNSRIYFHKYLDGDWAPKDIFFKKDVLLIAPGESITIHKKAIEKFIKKIKPIVIALNILENIQESLIDYRIACHPIRIFSDLEKYKFFKQPLIMPKKQLIGEIQKYPELKFLDFGLNVEKDIFKFHDKACTIPKPLVMAYALAMLNSGKTKKIYCAGFDGYNAGDPRQIEANEIWQRYFESEDFTSVVSITNTIYNIPTTSVYSF